MFTLIKSTPTSPYATNRTSVWVCQALPTVDELAKLEKQIKERSNEHENESDTVDGRNPALVDMVNIWIIW